MALSSDVGGFAYHSEQDERTHRIAATFELWRASLRGATDPEDKVSRKFDEDWHGSRTSRSRRGS